MKKMFYKKEIFLLVGTAFFVSFLFLYNVIPIDVHAQQLKNGMTISDTKKIPLMSKILTGLDQ